MKFLLALLLLLSLAFVAKADETTQHLLDVSVTVKSGSGQGSGVMFSRDGHTFVWTAAHVVDNLRKSRTVTINGSPKTVIEFDDAAIVQEFKEGGRRIGETKMDAKVLRYSDAEYGEDLALLLIRKSNFTQATAKFYLEDEIPEIGTKLYHVGSLLGQFGSNSLTTGVIAQTGRVLALGKDTVFDQTTATAFPGSSGGGVFLQNDGRYVGMLVRGAGEGFNFIVPVRRLQTWAKDAKVEWAINPAIALPADFDKGDIEDVGVTFKSGYNSAKPANFLLKRDSVLDRLLK
jgi:hypothetical protein